LNKEIEGKERTNMNHGILGDPAKWEELRRRPANSNDWAGIAPDDPLRVAIEETVRSHETQAMRIHLAHSLRGIFDDEMEAETGRLLALPEKTMRAYKAAFASFRAWSHEEGLPSLPTLPEVIAHYLVDRAAQDVKPKALDQIIAAIKWVHDIADNTGHRPLSSGCAFDAPVIRAAVRWVENIWAEDAERIAQAASKLTTTTTKQPKRKG
jgi:hypothetical protein